MRVGITVNAIPYRVEHLAVAPETQHLIAEVLAKPAIPPRIFVGPQIAKVAQPLTAEELDAMFKPQPVPVPLPPNWQTLIPAKAAPALSLELTKALFDAIPAGTPVPTAVEGIAAVVAGFDLLKTLQQPDADNGFETFLVCSSDVVDIASFISHVVPGLHALDMPLTILGIALKSRETVHTFSLTPQYGTFATGMRRA